MSGIVAVASLAGTAGSVLAQSPVAAPTSAQRYEVRYLVERFDLMGALIDQGVTSQFFAGVANPSGGGNLVKVGGGTFQSDVSVGRVDITIQSRVGIVAGTHNQSNLGISRLGGAGSATTGFRMTFTDIVSRDKTLSQGTLARGDTGTGPATGGGNNFGMYAPMRGTFPGWGPNNQGDNLASVNGSLNNPATGTLAMFNATGGRTVNFGSPGTTSDNFNGSGAPAGVGTLNAEGTAFVGPELEFANYYKLTYTPREDLTAQGFRSINVAVFAQSARYIFNYNGSGQASNGATALIGDQSFTFFVPTPGAAAVLGLGGLAIARRRRA
ncbi:MAG: hypothetical protein ACKVS8_05825 [Phycisphaerales bacterium]